MAALKDTVLVAMFCVILHPLQVLLVALEAPGVVFELRAGSIAHLQAVVEHLGLLEPLTLLLAFDTGGVRTEVGQPDRQITANLVELFLRDLNKPLSLSIKFWHVIRPVPFVNLFIYSLFNTMPAWRSLNKLYKVYNFLCRLCYRHKHPKSYGLLRWVNTHDS